MIRAATHLGVFFATAVLGVVTVTTGVRPDLVAVVGTLLWGAQAIILYLLAPWDGLTGRSVCLLAAWLVSALLMFQVAQGFWALVLAVRGERVQAVVAAVHESGDGLTTYTLRYDGELLPGRLTHWPESSAGAFGEPVEVVHDPGGLVDPRLPQEFDDARAGTPVLVPFTALVVAGLCLAGTREPGRNRAARP